MSRVPYLAGKYKIRMAATTRKKEQRICTCKVLLNGRVAPHVQANIVKEMLKHLMLQRNQIPMAYEQMKYEYERRQCGSAAATSRENGKHKNQQELSSSVYKRLGQLITTVEEQLANIDAVFNLSFVPRVLILLGATAVSPKEVHEIVFSNQASVHDGSLVDLRTKHCVRALMRTLIADSSIWEAKQLPLTNTLLLVRAHRDSGLTWFQPKMSLKGAPSRGQLYRCEIHCGHVENSLGCAGDCSKLLNGNDEHRSDCVHGQGNNKTDNGQATMESVAESDDYIWYQAPVPIKGVQPFAAKAPSASDIWA
ncbi:MAD2L1-binding protein-like [Patiria miniata]|uniref:Uncharacterized protein n=1 Tax=Patiria miniata TaxID=46514 RepID=A0A914BB69_PATMI|nr:MAD2L1-binding protein-like [Patiria miniata]